MKTIGLIGGTSPASTLEYYRLINEKVSIKLGRQHSAKLVLASVDFEEITEPLFADNWIQISEVLTKAAMQVQRAGADFILLCSNTLSQAMPVIKSHITLPVLHILQPTCSSIAANGYKKVALLGTEYTMQKRFHRSYIENYCDVTVITPDKTAQKIINQMIFDELCHGIVTESSKRKANDIILNLKENEGVDAVILGCTELPLLFNADVSTLPLINTTELHATAAVEFAISDLDKTFLWGNQDESIRKEFNLYPRLEPQRDTSSIAVGF